MTEPIEFPIKRDLEERPGERPSLLRIPEYCPTVEHLIGTAARLEGITGAVFLGWRDGRLIYLNAGVSTAEANWMLDLGKSILMPQPEKIG